MESHDRRRPYRLTSLGAATLRAHLDAQRRVAELGPAPAGGGLGRGVNDESQAEAAARRAPACSAGTPGTGGPGTAMSSPSCSSRTSASGRIRGAATPTWPISGVLARLIPTGLTGHAIDPADQVRASLASLGYLLGVFLSLGVALWAQLTVAGSGRSRIARPSRWR